jgi:hypothetical protein
MGEERPPTDQLLQPAESFDVFLSSPSAYTIRAFCCGRIYVFSSKPQGISFGVFLIRGLFEFVDNIVQP